MLPKNKRANKSEVQNIIKNGKKIYSPIFSFCFLDDKLEKIAFIVPKKVANKATERNKLRRIGYNLMRKIKKTLYSGVFIYKKSLKNTNKDEIEKEIDFLLKKQQKNEASINSSH
jgi:ribonuclease P protein component